MPSPARVSAVRPLRPLSMRLSVGRAGLANVLPVKAFVTGGTGFIGERLVQRLRDRGDDVVALVRSREKGAKLEQLGATLVEGDLSSSDAIHKGVQGCDSAFHVAAVYKVGIPEKEHEAMYDANVRGTERVLDAAFQAGVRRVVYAPPCNVLGNARGERA